MTCGSKHQTSANHTLTFVEKLLLLLSNFFTMFTGTHRAHTAPELGSATSESSVSASITTSQEATTSVLVDELTCEQMNSLAKSIGCRVARRYSDPNRTYSSYRAARKSLLLHPRKLRPCVSEEPSRNNMLPLITNSMVSVDLDSDAGSDAKPEASCGLPGPEDHLVQSNLAVMLERDGNAIQLVEFFTGYTVNEYSAVFGNGASTVFVNNDRTHVVKLQQQHNLEKARKSFNSEVDSSRVVQCLRESHPSLPGRVFAHANRSARVHMLVMPYYGDDAIEIINRNVKIGIDFVISFVTQMSGALRVLHDAHIVHDDIKPENATYNDVTGRWTMIDFGLARNLHMPNWIERLARGKMHAHPIQPQGTYPFILPWFGSVNRRADVPAKLFAIYDKYPVQLLYVGDIFALALSAVAIFGVYHRSACRKCLHESSSLRCDFCNGAGPLSVIDLEKIYDIATYDCLRPLPIHKYGHYCETPVDTLDDNFITGLMVIMSEIVLTQMDCSRRYCVWDTRVRRCTFEGENRLFCSSREEVRNDDVFELWYDDLPEMIAKFKRAGCDTYE